MKISTIIKQLDNTSLMELGKSLCDELKYRNITEWEYITSHPNGNKVTIKCENKKR